MLHRVGCVPYLNALPLVGRAPSNLDVMFDVPSRLPQRLESGDVQAILVSSIEAFRRPDTRVVDGVGISCQGPVYSVRMFSRVPWPDVKTLALDSASMTSNALAQIILAERFGVRPETQAMAPCLETMLDKCDAALLIGDNGMRAPGLPAPFGEPTSLYVLDLGEAWWDLTGLPFVWALWMGGPLLTDELADVLRRSAQDGQTHAEELIEEGVERFGFSLALTGTYLGQIMDYTITQDHHLGLQRFGALVRHHLHPDFNATPHWVGRTATV
jgi:chorismate dehydratase